jgi:hypothetical protein
MRAEELRGDTVNLRAVGDMPLEGDSESLPRED